MTESPQSLTLRSTTESIGVASEFVRKGAREANLPESRMCELDLLMEEILMNISVHSYPHDAPGIVIVAYSVPAAGELAVEISDQGAAFNPLSATLPDLTLDLEQRPVGGLGILLLRTLANSLSYCREQGWNKLKFEVSATS